MTLPTPTPPHESQDWTVYRDAAEILWNELQKVEQENRNLRQQLFQKKFSQSSR